MLYVCHLFYFLKIYIYVVANDGTTTLYEYDANGNRTAVKYANGMTTTYEYDKLNRLINEETIDKDTNVVVQYVYTLGLAGERLKVTEYNCGIIIHDKTPLCEFLIGLFDTPIISHFWGFVTVYAVFRWLKKWGKSRYEGRDIIAELQEALPDTKIIHGYERYTQMDSFYAKVTSAEKAVILFKLCEKNGKIISDVEFRLFEKYYNLSDCESEIVAIYFDKNGNIQDGIDIRKFKVDDVLKIYYDYSDTSGALKVEEYNKENGQDKVAVYAYRVDMVLPAK